MVLWIICTQNDDELQTTHRQNTRGKHFLISLIAPRFLQCKHEKQRGMSKLCTKNRLKINTYFVLCVFCMAKKVHKKYTVLMGVHQLIGSSILSSCSYIIELISSNSRLGIKRGLRWVANVNVNFAIKHCFLYGGLFYVPQY